MVALTLIYLEDQVVTPEELGLIRMSLGRIADEHRRLHRGMETLAAHRLGFDEIWESHCANLQSDFAANQVMRRAAFLSDRLLWFFDQVGTVVADYITVAPDATIRSHRYIHAQPFWIHAAAWPTSHQRVFAGQVAVLILMGNELLYPNSTRGQQIWESIRDAVFQCALDGFTVLQEASFPTLVV